MVVDEATFLTLALEEPNAQLELHCGIVRHKPGMSAAHNETMMRLAGWLFQQVDRGEFRVRCNSGHVRQSAERYYIPDVAVLPTALVLPQLPQHVLEVYRDPLPLVVEIWSPSTGDYDVETKLPEYQRRGGLLCQHPDGGWWLQPNLARLSKHPAELRAAVLDLLGRIDSQRRDTAE